MRLIKEKYNWLRFLSTSLFLLLAGCSTTTITEQPGDYRYGVGEKISVIDIDSRKTLGTVTITGIAVIIDKPFELTVSDGTDESGNTKYKQETYQQVVQVYYKSEMNDSSRTPGAGNFSFEDSHGNSCIGEPDTDYTRKEQEDRKSLVYAVKQKGDYIDGSYRYQSLQVKPTARLRLKLAAKN